MSSYRLRGGNEEVATNVSRNSGKNISRNSGTNVSKNSGKNISKNSATNVSEVPESVPSVNTTTEKVGAPYGINQTITIGTDPSGNPIPATITGFEVSYEAAGFFGPSTTTKIIKDDSEITPAQVGGRRKKNRAKKTLRRRRY
jgi:hypothetical protein